jgi:hypothetical protein
MTWTTAADVQDAWIGHDAPTYLNLIETWIGKAERLIRFRVPTVTARLLIPEAGLLETIVDVTTSMVIRKFRNPEGIRTASTGDGPFTQSRTYGGDEPGELVILDSELAMLSGSGSTGQKAFSINLIPTSSPYSPLYVVPLVTP